jgi:seryl-tRNA synthetase
MLDIKLIRKDPKTAEKKIKDKLCDVDMELLLSTDKTLREKQTTAEELKSKRNTSAKEIGQKKAKGESIQELTGGLKKLSDEITNLDEEITALTKKRDDILAPLPNLAFDDIPVSEDPANNKCIKTFGEKPKFSFQFKNHLELNEKLKLFDFIRSAKTSGNRWPLYTNMGAKLEWALLNYMLEIHRKNGFIQIMPPLLVKPEIMYGSGQLPKFESQLFKIKDKDYQLYLIPTAEILLNGMHSDEIFEKEELPKFYVAYSPCFRREAGAAGKNERGLIRTHQFNKVELFCFTTPENSAEAFQTMQKSAEEVLQGLNMHYRNMLLVTGDMSFGSAKTIDIEVWLPGQDRYYEVSSISNCTDFQARRSQIRYKEGKGKPNLAHTLNGSGVATSRLMVALLENNQNEDGSINIPAVLQKYLDDEVSIIKPS